MTDPMHGADRPEPHTPACGARCRDGHPCTNPPVRGAARCRMHGSAAPQVKAAAGRRLATLEWSRTFGNQLTEADPSETVLGEIRWAAGHVEWLRQKVAEQEPDGVLDGGWVRTYTEERALLVRMCEVAHRMGISERSLELAERIGGLMSDLISGVLEELGLTQEQQQAASLAVPRRLRALAGQLGGEAS